MILFVFLFAFIPLSLVKTEGTIECDNSAEAVKTTEECNETEYQSYVECMRRRMKRDTNCNRAKNCTDCQESSCQQCDCNFCAVNVCESNCESCCADNPPCKSKRCCHKTCHSRCKSIPCRTDCRRNCIEKVALTEENLEGNATTIEDKPRHNVTTIIDIHNYINNTNEIQIPVQVNNTNYNNFTLGHQENPSPTQTENPEPCCHIISPRQCVPKQEYPFVRCFQMRKKACGSICQAPTLLEQPREICDQANNATNCRQQLVYVPQPQPQYQPSCSFQPVWPYINCASPQYGFYGPMAPQFPPTGCFGCYNDVYGSSPYYRPPFYGQGYPPVPYGYPTAIPNYLPYPPVSYEGVKTDSRDAAAAPNDSTAYLNKKEITQNPYQYMYQPQPLPAWQPFYPVQMSPLGYAYPPQVPLYYLPPEVDIQATVSHPEKGGRYAQITITDKKEAPDPNSITEENVLPNTTY